MSTERSPHPASAGERRGDDLVDFLVARLTEDLALLWERDKRSTGRDRPGLAAQVAVVDELLTTVRSGLLPHRRELRILLYGYGAHPDYDPAWVARIVRAG